jgi:hypothetical protein
MNRHALRDRADPNARSRNERLDRVAFDAGEHIGSQNSPDNPRRRQPADQPPIDVSVPEWEAPEAAVVNPSAA